MPNNYIHSTVFSEAHTIMEKKMYLNFLIIRSN